MNTRTLGRFCTPRIGRADIDVASLAVDLNSRARRLCYPRSNFSVIPGPHQGGHRSSLGPAFASGLHLVSKPVRLAFALALYWGFLTPLSQPLGAVDIFSTACHPSQTVHKLLSLFRGEQCRSRKMVFHRYRLSCDWLSSHLRYIPEPAPQQHATVKFHGVFASHWKSLASAPEGSIRRILGRDSGDLVTPLMQVVNQTTRYYARCCYWLPFQGTGSGISADLMASLPCSDCIFRLRGLAYSL